MKTEKLMYACKKKKLFVYLYIYIYKILCGENLIDTILVKESC